MTSKSAPPTANEAADNGQSQPQPLAVVVSVQHGADPPEEHRTTLEGLDGLMEKIIQGQPHNAFTYIQQAATICRSLYQTIGSIEAIDRGMALRRKALATLALDDSQRISVLGNLGQDRRLRFQKSGLKSDLESSICLIQEARSNSSITEQTRYTCMYELGRTFKAKYEAFKSLVDLDLSIENLQQSLGRAGEGVIYQTYHFRALGSVYDQRYEVIHDTRDFEKARQAHQSVIDMEGASNEQHAQALFDLAEVTFHMFKHCITQDLYNSSSSDGEVGLEHSGVSDFHNKNKQARLSQINEVISLIGQSLEKTTEADLLKSKRRAILSIMYLHRHSLTGAAIDADTSAELVHVSFQSIPEGDNNRVILHEYLGFHHEAAYKATGRIHHLQASVDHHNKALDGTPGDHPELASRLLNAGLSRIYKYERFGTIEDFEAGQSLLQRSLDNPTPDPIVRQRILGSLALHGYGRRSLVLGALADADAAIARSREALQMSSQDDEICMKVLSGLGMAYAHRYYRTRSLQDLQDCIETLEKALRLASGADIYKADTVCHLARAYELRYEADNEITDINKAIELYEDSVMLGRERIVYQGERLRCVSWAYFSRYPRTLDQSDLDKAFIRIKEAIRHTPANHPNRPFCVQQYASMLGTQAGKSIKSGDEVWSLNLLQEALDQPFSPPFHRILSGMQLARRYRSENAWTSAYRTIEKTVSLVPLLARQSLQSSDIQFMIKDIVGLSSDAVAYGMQVGRSPFEVLSLLEMGRGVIQTSLNSIRSDVSDLEANYPELAKTFMQARDQLEAPLPLQVEESMAQAEMGSILRSQDVDLRYAASQTLERTIREIRQQSGFERFLLGPSESDMKAAAVSGPIVIINVSLRCDAFIIETDEIKNLWLPLLSLEKIKVYEAKMKSGRIHSTLEWLWKVIVRPVLRVLGFKSQPVDSWPRICWIPTGPLSKFPIHAAGLHLDGGSDALMDRAISTYSTSIRAVVESRQYHPDLKSSPRVAGLVGVEKTLPAVKTEIEAVSRICQSMQMQVLQTQPLQSAVMTVLSTCDIFHFAGHGRTHGRDPLQSALMLSDGPLTLENLFKTNARRRRPLLAYLSACGTGQVKHQSLADESLHLIAACQVAGFRNVVGTLWKVEDEICVKMARHIYSWMKEHTMEENSIGSGFHDACRMLRSDWVHEVRELSNHRSSTGRDLVDYAEDDEEDPANQAPLHWVPFVLFSS